MSTNREGVARALAYFEGCDDMGVLRGALEDVAPTVKQMVGRLLRKGPEGAIPGPAELRGAREAASRDEALGTLLATDDFPLLQTLTRAIGRRIEALEIVASAEIEVGGRVRVPSTARYPATGPWSDGTVESTGTVVEVLLDNGETWSGPASLVEVVR